MINITDDDAACLFGRREFLVEANALARSVALGVEGRQSTCHR
jgi:hypothetical protein